MKKLMVLLLCAVVGCSTPPPKSLPPSGADQLASFDRMISELRDKNRGIPLYQWSEADQRLLSLYTEGRKELEP